LDGKLKYFTPAPHAENVDDAEGFDYGDIQLGDIDMME
jgi:hypothetical protein